MKERNSGEFGIVYEEWEQPDLADAEGWRCLCVSLSVSVSLSLSVSMSVSMFLNAHT
jgi:hypothetical protein